MDIKIQTSDDVKEIFDYSDGKLLWKSDRGFKIKSGDVAGSLDHKGYKQVKIGKYCYKLHRLIFLYHKGYLPSIIDHINNDRTDNRIENLREASPSESSCNRGLQSNNSSGIKGVYWCNKRQKWEAYCHHKRKKKHLGRYETIEQAEQMVKNYRELIHGDYCNHG